MQSTTQAIRLRLRSLLFVHKRQSLFLENKSRAVSASSILVNAVPAQRKGCLSRRRNALTECDRSEGTETAARKVGAETLLGGIEQNPGSAKGLGQKGVA